MDSTNPRYYEVATQPQLDYIWDLFNEVSRGWDARKRSHFQAEVSCGLFKGDASRWISKLVHIRNMQRYYGALYDNWCR